MYILERWCVGSRRSPILDEIVRSSGPGAKPFRLFVRVSSILLPASRVFIFVRQSVAMVVSLCKRIVDISAATNAAGFRCLEGV